MAVLGAGIPWCKQQFFTSNGEVCAGYYLHTYKVGTDTPAATWTTADLATKNANPIVLDSAGRADIFVDRTVAYKFVLTSEAANPPQSPLWTYELPPSVPYYSINNSIDRDNSGADGFLGQSVRWVRSGVVQTLTTPNFPVVLYNAYVNNGTGSAEVSIPAGTLEKASLTNKGDAIILEWEMDYASAIQTARSDAFGTSVDVTTGAASTLSRARYVLSRETNADIHVSTMVWQNTGGGAVQVQMGQQTIGSLDLDATDYTVDMKMSAGTYTIRGARAYFLRYIGDWTAR